MQGLDMDRFQKATAQLVVNLKEYPDDSFSEP